MNKGNILIVDDEAVQRKVLKRYIDDLGYKSITMENGRQVVDFFNSKQVISDFSAADIDAILLDLSMPEIDGITVLGKIAETKGDTQVIVLTASTDVSMAISAINFGAIDYVVKGEPDVFSRVTASIRNAIDKKTLKYQVSQLSRKGKDRLTFSDVIGASDAINKTIRLAKKAVNTNISVLIEGSPGSGKEILARAIHGSGQYAGKPFIAIACDMLRSGGEEELFGFVEDKNAESVFKNLGKLREAHNGTLYLDKIDCLRTDIQMKILRFMQEGEFMPIGSKIPIRSNVRIISSTSRDLQKMVLAKKFREDLFYRISTFSIRVPDLKERGEEDIKILADRFCRDFSVNENKKIKAINPEALRLMYDNIWEDNIRQLKNTIFRAVVLCEGDMLTPEEFPQFLNKENSNSARKKSEVKKSADVNSELVDIFDEEGRCKTFEQIEEEIITRLVEIYNGNLSEVSKRLNIGRSTIYRKLRIIGN